MTLEEKIILFKEKGFTCNLETGDVTSFTGKKISGKTKQGYIGLGINVNKKQINISAHQFIWYIATGKVSDTIDHINLDKSDNRLCNLRNITHQKNLFNTHAKGFTWDKQTNKYKAQIQLNSKSITLGRFDTPEEAREAYLKAKEIYHII